jgi:cell division protein FtsA
MADASIASRSVVGYADTGDEMKLTRAERAWALRRAADQATCADDERIDIIPEKWVVRDGKGEREVANPVGEHGARLLCHALLVTARAGYTAELKALVEGLNVEVEGIIAQPLALYYAIRKDLMKRGTALIVDSGARCTTIMVRNQGRLVHLQTYAFGGDDLTRAIAEGLHISPAQAEALKCDLDISAEADPTYHHDGQQFIWGEVRERNRLALPASRIAADLIDRFFRARADELRDMGRLAQHGQVHLFGRTCALGGLAARLKDVLGLPVVLGTGNKERDPGAEMSDALVSGLVCAAADLRRQHLDENPDPLRKTATGVWDWLTKRVE